MSFIAAEQEKTGTELVFISTPSGGGDQCLACSLAFAVGTQGPADRAPGADHADTDEPPMAAGLPPGMQSARTTQGPIAAAG